MKRVSTLALSLLCAFAIFALTSSTDGQTRTRRPRRATAATTATAAARTSSSPKPIAVPRLPATASAPSGNGQTTTNDATAATTAAPVAQNPAPAPTPASGEAAEDDDDIVRVTSNLVVVPVSVTNATGEPVVGLKREDFLLDEEGRAQEIAELGAADQVPLDIAILFDTSSSVTAKSFYDFQQEAAARFLKQVLKPIDRAAVFTLSDRPRLEQQLASAEVASLKLTSIPAATKSTPTAFYDTVISAAQYLAKNATARNRRVIVVISDGEDNFSSIVRETTVAAARGDINKAEAVKRQRAQHARALLEVQREVQRADAVFYSINPTGPGFRLNEISTRAQTTMQQVATATGGTAFVPDGRKEFDTVFRQIANELRAQYLLQYYSNSGAAPGKYLGIGVRLPARSDLRVRARQGYYVPQPK